MATGICGCDSPHILYFVSAPLLSVLGSTRDDSLADAAAFVLAWCPAFAFLVLLPWYYVGGVEGENVSITGTGFVVRCLHVHVSSAISNSCLVLGCTLCCFVGGLFIDIPLYFGDDHRRLVGRGRGVPLLAHPLGQPSSDTLGIGG